VDKDNNFDALDVGKFFFGDDLDLLSDAGINNDEMVEVLLVLCKFDGHGIVEDLQFGQLVVHFAILGAQVKPEHLIFYFIIPRVLGKPL
jgi:hypothetical protein